MTTVSEGARVYEFNWLLTGDAELYAHDEGLWVLWSPSKRKQIAIDPIGMTRDEQLRAITAADTLLARAGGAPVNRKQRRAMN